MAATRPPRLPDLTFPSLQFGVKETPWDLRPFLYRGGAALPVAEVAWQIDRGLLGKPILQRIPLVAKIHEHVSYLLASGRSRRGVATDLYQIRYFFSYTDQGGLPLTIDSIQDRYLDWTAFLLQRVRIDKTLKHQSAYHMASHAGTIVDAVLEREKPIVRLSRIKPPHRAPPTMEKQALNDAFKFGSMLFDICNGLSPGVIRGTLPVQIKLRSGQTIEKWGVLRTTKHRSKEHTVAAHSADTSNAARSTIVNLKIEAEILIFIGNTTMNWVQALRMKRGDFAYASYKDGYQVRRRRKDRKQGEVEFEIFRDYRPHLEAYLSWLNAMFPSDRNGLLFPFIVSSPVHSQIRAIKQITEVCRELDIRYIGPRALRGTRLNFLARETKDISLTAQMGQHTEKTLVKSYLRPNYHVALMEIHRFHLKTDPAFAPPGPGVCISPIPALSVNAPEKAPTPDCANPSGCIFCSKQRDEDSQDYVWSLASLRHLKLFELARDRSGLSFESADMTPVELEIEVLSQKVALFEGSNSNRKAWVAEAIARVQEGHYHPKWDGFIRIMEQSI